MKKRILIADDKKSIRTLLATALKDFDCEIDMVRNGYEAIKQMNKKQYDLVITDYRMPKMNGLELTQWIKSSHPSIPVLIITSSGPVQSFLNSGAAGFFIKPFNISKFINFIKTILDKGMN